MSSTAALISGLVASRATRNATWLCLSATKVLFSEMTGASRTCIRRFCCDGLRVDAGVLTRRPLCMLSLHLGRTVGLRSHSPVASPEGPLLRGSREHLLDLGDRTLGHQHFLEAHQGDRVGAAQRSHMH